MAAATQPAGTVTLVFTDIEGSTRLLAQLGTESYREALAEHRRVVREACHRHEGYEVDYEGDAFFYAFSSAGQAVAAVSEALAGLEGGPIRIRVGLHTGQPTLDPPKYVGLDVHLAARVMASAHGGQVVLSQAACALLDERVRTRELGEHRLKDIDVPVALFQLGGARFPPLKTISNTNLPRPASSFVGRGAELARVLAQIGAGARLLTLTGPGGTGKTRLALEAATMLVPDYKAGVFWVGLANLRDAELVSETIAQTIGAEDGLADHIGEREMLLLLDNLEQVIGAAPELAALVSVCPNLSLLVTSRELLRVQGELEYPVPPLADAEAVSLFCQRARLEPSKDIRELCGRLDNLPLALELAAARTKALTPAQILERLSQRLDLLEGGRDSDPRQQTLRATIEWSHELLPQNEQQLFARLAAFNGGCTLEAAEEVCEADIDTLQSLVEKSLLRFTASEIGGRYWMLETIRDFASDQLSESGDVDQTRGHHARYYLGLAEETEPALLSSDQVAAVELLDSEHDNLREALAWLRYRHDDTALLRLAAALSTFWMIRGPVDAGTVWLEDALSRASGDTTARAKALFGLSMLLHSAGDYDGATRMGDASVDLYRTLGSEHDLARVLGHVANILANRGDCRRSEALHTESLDIYRHLGSAFGIGRSLANMSAVSLEMGDFAQAEARAQQALVHLERVNNPLLLAVAYGNWGIATLKLGRETEARSLLRRALDASHALGAPELCSCCLTHLAALFHVTDPVRAATLLGCVESLCERSGTQLPRFERRVFDETAADIQQRLDVPTELRAREEGRALDLDGGLDYAMRALDLTSPPSISTSD